MKSKNLTLRKTLNLGVFFLSTFITILISSLLIFIIYYIVIKGISAWNFSFFTELPTPMGVLGGGFANAIIGSLIMTISASVLAIPIGLFIGIYLNEFSANSTFANVVRTSADAITGIPSIIIGLFVYSFLVRPFRSFSGIAGIIALAIIMLPIIARISENTFSLISLQMREAALALGMTRLRATMSILMKSTKQALLSGFLLAIARISGETAPLLFTALNSHYFIEDLTKPTANLPVTIFQHAMSPSADWQNKAWGGALLITLFVLILNIMRRIFIKKDK